MRGRAAVKWREKMATKKRRPRAITPDEIAAVEVLAARMSEDALKPTTQTEHEIADVLDGIKAMLFRKNRAYGDSALKPMRVFSRADNVEQIKVRLDDKLSRLGRGHALPDESLEDTVDDIMGYLVLMKCAVIRRKKDLGARL